MASKIGVIQIISCLEHLGLEGYNKFKTGLRKINFTPDNSLTYLTNSLSLQ